jgi:hypothetical protein
MEEPEEYQELSIWNLNSIFEFVKENFIQILLLILVFIIIYIVDYISNVNALIFAMPSPIPTTVSTQKPQAVKIKAPRKKSFKK